jgi:hypothetical protein
MRRLIGLRRITRNYGHGAIDEGSYDYQRQVSGPSSNSVLSGCIYALAAVDDGFVGGILNHVGTLARRPVPRRRLPPIRPTQ